MNLLSYIKELLIYEELFSEASDILEWEDIFVLIVFLKKTHGSQYAVQKHIRRSEEWGGRGGLESKIAQSFYGPPPFRKQ